MVDFTLNGQQFMALSAGPLDPFNHAVSFVVNCESQEEVDRYWEALLKGGNPEQCGWLKDRYGFSLAGRPDRAQSDDRRRRPTKSKTGDRGDVEDGEVGHYGIKASL
jgi:predicted 3-demethylubiquinone-9 3-methyltransferase (glyoxalase superfamily)